MYNNFQTGSYQICFYDTGTQGIDSQTARPKPFVNNQLFKNPLCVPAILNQVVYPRGCIQICAIMNIWLGVCLTTTVKYYANVEVVYRRIKHRLGNVCMHILLLSKLFSVAVEVFLTCATKMACNHLGSSALRHNTFEGYCFDYLTVALWRHVVSHFWSKCHQAMALAKVTNANTEYCSLCNESSTHMIVFNDAAVVHIGKYIRKLLIIRTDSIQNWNLPKWRLCIAWS